MNYTVSRSISERYDIRLANSSAWAIITLGESGGILSITSDFGDYAYNWPNHERTSFKHFLVEIDDSYLLTNLVGRKSVFNLDKTIEQWVRNINLSVSNNEITSEQSFEMLKRLGEIFRDRPDVYELVARSQKIPGLFDEVLGYSPHIHCDWPSNALQFVEKLWHPFVEELRKEIGGT